MLEILLNFLLQAFSHLLLAVQTFDFKFVSSMKWIAGQDLVMQSRGASQQQLQPQQAPTQQPQTQGLPQQQQQQAQGQTQAQGQREGLGHALHGLMGSADNVVEAARQAARSRAASGRVLPGLHGSGGAGKQEEHAEQPRPKTHS